MRRAFLISGRVARLRLAFTHFRHILPAAVILYDHNDERGTHPRDARGSHLETVQ